MATSASKQATTEASAMPPLEGAALPEGMAASLAPQASMDSEQRHGMIAEAAFFIAQARGFSHGQELQDWLAAEREIERRLSNPDH